MRRVLAVALAAAFLLSGCGVTEGTVYDKSYEKAHYEDRSRAIYRQWCHPASETYTTYVNGQSQTRTRYYTKCEQVYAGQEHYRVWVEDEWCLYFRNKDGDKGHKCVGPETYDFYEVGDYFEPADDDDQ